MCVGVYVQYVKVNPRLPPLLTHAWFASTCMCVYTCVSAGVGVSVDVGVHTPATARRGTTAQTKLCLKVEVRSDQ